MPKVSAQITAVQTAISAIEGGAQSYMLDGIQYTRGNLRSLYARERQLQRVRARRLGRQTFVDVDLSEVSD